MKNNNKVLVSNYFDIGPRKSLVAIFLIFIIMTGLNYLTPMIFGDDYVYTFVWQTKQTMNTPLPESAKRLISFYDILLSQWNHYFSWSGRTVAHIIVQFFAWKGKLLFNIFNPLVFIILLLQISWIANGGIISLTSLKPHILYLTFFCFWAFTAGFNIVFLWIPGACNYVWTMVILLFFIMPYIYKYFHIDNIFYVSQKKYLLFFLLGIIAGWTNENTVCWILLVLGFWFLNLCKVNKLEKWMFYGYGGLSVGYLLLIFAPGNVARTADVTGNSLSFLSWTDFVQRLNVFGTIELFQLILWFYVFTSFRKINSVKLNDTYLRYVNLARVFCALSLLSNIVMLFAPDFQPRSGFPSLVFLTIAAILFVHLEDLSGVTLTNADARLFFKKIGCCYFLITFLASIWGLNLINQYTSSIIEAANHGGKHRILEIPDSPKITKKLWYASGFHLLFNELSENKNDCKNISFSRYFGIKGIRVVKLNDNQL